MARVRRNDKTRLIWLDVGVFYYGDVMEEWHCQRIKFKYLGHGAAGLSVETFRIAPEDYHRAIEIAEEPQREKPAGRLKSTDYDPDAIMPESRFYTIVTQGSMGEQLADLDRYSPDELNTKRRLQEAAVAARVSFYTDEYDQIVAETLARSKSDPRTIQEICAETIKRKLDEMVEMGIAPQEPEADGEADAEELQRQVAETLARLGRAVKEEYEAFDDPDLLPDIDDLSEQKAEM